MYTVPGWYLDGLFKETYFHLKGWKFTSQHVQKRILTVTNTYLKELKIVLPGFFDPSNSKMTLKIFYKQIFKLLIESINRVCVKIHLVWKFRPKISTRIQISPLTCFSVLIKYNVITSKEGLARKWALSIQSETYNTYNTSPTGFTKPYFVPSPLYSPPRFVWIKLRNTSKMKFDCELKFLVEIFIWDEFSHKLY